MKSKQIIIDYEEYLELVRYKEMVENAKNTFMEYNYPPSIEKYTQYIKCNELFCYLATDNNIEEIVLKIN